MAAFPILMNKTSVGFGAVIGVPTEQTRFDNLRQVQVQVEGVAPVSATVRIYGANDTSAPILIATVVINSSGTIASEVFQDDMPYEFYLAEVVSISANSKVSVVGNI